MPKRILYMLIFGFVIGNVHAGVELLPDTERLVQKGDLAAAMVEGINDYLMAKMEETVSLRTRFWERDYSSHERYAQSVAENRERLKTIIGVVDRRDPVEFECIAPILSPDQLKTKNTNREWQAGMVGEGKNYKIYAVRWNVFRGIEGEGLLLEPNGEVVANVIALPDCDWTPEMLAGLVEGIDQDAQFARRLVENRCRVLVPFLINREDTYSGIPQYRMTNQPHREFLYRAAYEMGRHIIGYEVQKVLAAVDWFRSFEEELPIGAIGYGEGGLLAFYSAAVDMRIDVACVSGYFQPREQLWQEPIYRNVWSLLKEFGDAEIASLIAPRSLIVEACPFPEISGSPNTPNRSGAAPGTIETPEYEEVQREFERAVSFVDKLSPSPVFRLVDNRDGVSGSKTILEDFLICLGNNEEFQTGETVPEYYHDFQVENRLKRQFDQLLDDTQYLMRESEFVRNEFWKKADNSSLDAWVESCEWYKNYFWDEIIGRLSEISLPANPRTRLVYDEPKYRGYETVLDVYPNVFAYGILLVPKDIKEGERRPVVVCQHGLEGRPQHVADPNVMHKAYSQYACQLAERGFITYAPQNPYIGQDRFRVLQRKAQPQKLSLFSFIVRQHEQTLEWLSSLPFVDAERIAFYGLSYGGKTAMRVPPLLEGYCLSICSADYNEWIWKNVSARHRYSYLLTGEYEMPEFNLGNTFNYAELSWLILPRPFMVERGHFDGVAPDEWVAYEYAKTRRKYDLLGIGDRTEIEFFTGPHSIHGVGTFDFLEEHLGGRGATDYR